MAISHVGKPFTQDSIGMALAMRDLMSQLRETGEVRGNNPVFAPKDRSNFLQGLENIIQDSQANQLNSEIGKEKGRCRNKACHVAVGPCHHHCAFE